MFGNALKISLRTLYREKRYAVINIAGLSLALACVVILGLYLRSELTYDKHYEGYENIYRVVNEFNTNGSTDDFAITSQTLGPLLVQEIPDIEEVVRFRMNSQDILLRRDELAYYWENANFVTPNVFEVFRQDIIYGDPETALDEPWSVAISETAAETYFGNDNPIGEILTTDSGQEHRVSLVFADSPENTHFKYDVLFTLNNPNLQDPTSLALQRRQLFGVNHYTYLKMREGYNPADWEAQSQAFYEKNMQEFGEANGMSWRSWLQPLADIHLGSSLSYDRPTGNLYYIYAFSAVAIFILLVACINYMNLSTARSAKRAREVGMRKILGSNRSALMVQFMSESILYSFIALIFAIVLVEVAFTFTNISELLNKPLNISITGNPGLILVAAVAALLIGIISGLYPALYLSSWQPLTALVGNKNSGKSSARFRAVLVFVQFTISVAVIASTLLMAQQMRFIADMNLGYEKENKLIVPLRGYSTIIQLDVIRNELEQHPDIFDTATTAMMFGENMGINAIPMENMNGEMETTQVNNMVVGSDFLELMKVDVLQGRTFGQRLLTDVGTSVVVNQALVDHMGWGDEALGKRFADGRVIGVIRDIHFASLHNPIEPFAMRTYPDDALDDVSEEQKPYVNRQLILSIAGDNIRETLGFIEETIISFDPRHPFEYRFFDQSLDELYQSEENLMTLIGIFAVICIFISCLGLYGLAAFTTEQRTREIGIRKVLGATAAQIIALLSRNILWLVFAGALVASVVSWLAIDEWLSGFSYRAGINPLAFVVATLSALFIAYATVALQSYKTAQSDPTLSLRYE